MPKHRTTNRIKFDREFLAKHETPGKPNTLIALRPGKEFGDWLTEFARVYGLSRGDAIRRLAIMSTKGFLAEPHYELLHKLHIKYRAMHGPKRESFLLTCAVARASLNKKCEEFDGPGESFTPAEEAKLLEAVLNVYATGQPTDLTLAR